MSAPFFYAFLSPLLLARLAAVAIPVAVHLFHFRRPQPVDFSTLRFLRAVEATAVRRLRLRQWLLRALVPTAALPTVRHPRKEDRPGLFAEAGAEPLEAEARGPEP